MFTEAEARELMALVHAVVIWHVGVDTPEAYESALDGLRIAADGVSQLTIEKLIAAINMRTMRAAQ